MSVYTQVFGGTTIYPSDVSLIALALSEDTTLEWPLESAGGANLAARIVDVTPSASGYSVIMPDAMLTGIGQTILFNNLSGSYSFYIKDYDGNTIATVAYGEQWQIYLSDISTQAGTWQVFRYGASTATVQASALAGFGLKVTGSQLSTANVIATFSSNRSVTANDRAFVLVYDDTGAATLSLLSAASAGNDFYFSTRNEGGGDLTIDPAGTETINGASTLVLKPGDSAVVITDGISWYTVGLGQEPVFAFDYTSIDLASASDPYTLSGSELNRIAYEFVGLLTNNVDVVVPPTTQQYWVNNQTTGSYALGLRTASQVSAILVPQGYSSILYCNGNEVILAAASTETTPSTVYPAAGGTGITSYTVGDIIYASGATTLSKLSDVATGNALISGGLTTAPAWGKIGLATHVSGTLPVANGGTGATTLTGYVIGNGTSAFTASANVPLADISGLGTGVGTFLATPSSANLAAAVTDETGSGALVFANTPTLVSPVLGTPTSGNLANCTSIPVGNATGTLAVANGGTGQTTYTNGQILIGNTTSGGLDKATITAGSGVTVTNSAGGISIAATGTGGTVTSVDVTPGTTGLTFTGGPITTSGNITVAGTLVAANGGTGQSSYTTGDILYASSSSALSKLADVATGNSLISGGVGTAPSWGKIGLTTHISGTLAAGNGGTGQSSYTTGDILYASSSSALSKLADVATGNSLISGGVGTAPSWGKIGLTTHISGTLPVANGGTGQTAYTNGQILIGNTTSTGLDKATLTAGSGVSITNAAGSITIAATGSGGTVTSVDVNGGSTGLTFSGGPVTSSGNITMAGTLAVANGGTGVTTKTGTGSVVLSASPTLTGLVSAGNISASGTVSATGNVSGGNLTTAGVVSATGNVSGGNVTATTAVTDAIGNVRTITQNAQTTGYTLQASDNGKHISITTGGVTVPASVFSAGQSVAIYNNSGSSQTITQGASATMYLVGTATTGNRTLAQRGLATVLCVGTDTFVITGGGLS